MKETTVPLDVLSAWSIDRGGPCHGSFVVAFIGACILIVIARYVALKRTRL
jgi:uncharacterized membrane protein YeaQ/YmgE (transglycosylase-associated protein family)